MRRRTKRETANRETWRILYNLLSEIVTKQEVTDDLFDSFNEFYEFLVEENEKYNLTSLKDERSIIIKHFVDCLLPLSLGKLYQVEKFKAADVGSGAGFPGLLHAALYKQDYFTLIDATQKRCNFLTRSMEIFKLSNVVVIWGRSEDIAHQNQHRERYDYAMARALAPLPVLLELSIPLLKVEGELLAYKGPNIRKEIEQCEKGFKELHCEIKEVMEYELPEFNEMRTLVKIKKLAPTPDKYPRTAGTPARRPLK